MVTERRLKLSVLQTPGVRSRRQEMSGDGKIRRSEGRKGTVSEADRRPAGDQVSRFIHHRGVKHLEQPKLVSANSVYSNNTEIPQSNFHYQILIWVVPADGRKMLVDHKVRQLSASRNRQRQEAGR